MQITQLPKVHQGLVSEDYIDLMDHMNIHYYVKFFNDSALNFFASFGFDEAYFKRTGNGLFLLEQHIVYLREQRLGDEIELYARALGLSHKVIHYMIFMVNKQTSELSATSEMVSAHISKANRRTTPFDQTILTEYKRLLDQHQSLSWEPPLCGIMSA